MASDEVSVPANKKLKMPDDYRASSMYFCLNHWYVVELPNQMDDDAKKVNKRLITQPNGTLITKPNGTTTYATLIRPLTGMKRATFAGAAIVGPFIYVVGGGLGFEVSKRLDRYDTTSGECV